MRPTSWREFASCRPTRRSLPRKFSAGLKAVARNEAAAYRLHVLGLAYYRAGSYQTAIEYLDKSNANRWTDAAR